jgi:membrane complex biogenesis BtpA family protein
MLENSPSFEKSLHRSLCCCSSKRALNVEGHPVSVHLQTAASLDRFALVISPLQFANPKPLIGMVHLLALPGAPDWSGSLTHVIDRALRDAAALKTAGFDALLVENFGDTPFLPDKVAPETVAAFAVVADRLRQHSRLPLGINVLRNDAASALAIAHAVDAHFIRVNVHTSALLTDQGWITGRAHETLRLRTQLNAHVAICADVFVKHAVPLAGTRLADAAAETFERGRADVLIVSGSATGTPTDPSDITTVREAVPNAPIWIGSGLTADNAAALLALAAGAIVGSSIKHEGRAQNPVDPARAARLVQAARALL